ncbi:MAG: hypothetical protein MZV70_74640 [Desulfobacterales bacterium]|nr:hypothetical protein [Desulfobacterales bacterium]
MGGAAAGRFGISESGYSLRYLLFVFLCGVEKALIGDNAWTNLDGVKYLLSFGWDQLDRCKNHPTGQASEAIANGAKVVCFNPLPGVL